VEWARGDGRRHRCHAARYERVERHRRSKAKAPRDRAIAPAGVQVVAGYDRSGLINDSIATLQRDLLEEAIIVSLVIIVFLFHFRSALIAIVALPIAVLVSFIPIYFLGVTSNIMSLGGIALAVGVLVDAAIVMVENGYRHLSERHASDETPVSEPERREILINAAKQLDRRCSSPCSSSSSLSYLSFCSKHRRGGCFGPLPGRRRLPWVPPPSLLSRSSRC